MSELILRSFCNPRASVVVPLLVLLAVGSVAAQRPEPRPKRVHGAIQNLNGEPIAGARVFIRNMEKNVIQILTTDEDGLYSISGLPPDTDYEVHAEFRGVESKKRVISMFLKRPDNLLNFDLEVALVSSDRELPDNDGPKFNTFDLVQIRGSFELPTGIPAPIPAVLLLHGYGENRAVWRNLEQRLLKDGWAVLAIDLRGHGRSKTKNGEPIEAQVEWRMDSRQFPLDLGPALNWLKSQTRLNSSRIVVIGADVGANLALIASGRFAEVGTAVAINPRLDEALAMAGSAQDFVPRSALLMVGEKGTQDGIRNYIVGPSRVVVVPADRRTAAVLAAPRTLDEIIRWLKDVY